MAAWCGMTWNIPSEHEKDALSYGSASFSLSKKESACVDAGDHKGRPYRVGGAVTVAPPRAAGPTEKNKETFAGREGNRHPRFPPRGIAAAAYAKNVPLAHFLNAAAPGESAEGGYPTFLRLWFPPRGCPEQPLRPPLKMCHRHIFLTLRGPGAARVGPLPARELQNDMWQFASHTQDTCTFKGHTRLL